MTNKYSNTTPEQRQGMTAYLRQLFEHQVYCLDKIGYYDVNEIKAYQQAQKAEIESIMSSFINSVFTNVTVDTNNRAQERLAKLKWESELE